MKGAVELHLYAGYFGLAGHSTAQLTNEPFVSRGSLLDTATRGQR